MCHSDINRVGISDSFSFSLASTAQSGFLGIVESFPTFVELSVQEASDAERIA